MLPRSHRLRDSAEFGLAVRRGRRAGGRLLVVHLSATSGTDPTRVGFVVSRAVGNAVVRNTVKRRLRHLVRARLGALPPASVVVVRANPAAATASFSDLGRALDSGLARALDEGDRAAPVTAAVGAS